MKENRCQALTKKGERCKNSIVEGKYCYTHQNQNVEKVEKLVTFSLVLSTASTLIILIEKAAKYYPEIVGWLSMIDASTKCMGAQPRPLDSLRSDLNREELWAIQSYGRILNHHLTEKAHQNSPKELDLIPTELKSEIIDAYDELKISLGKNYDLISEERKCIEECCSALTRWIWLIGMVDDCIYPKILDSFVDEVDSWEHSWWKPEELEHYTWRAVILAEHIRSSKIIIEDALSKCMALDFSATCISSLMSTCDSIIEASCELKRLGETHL